MEAVILIGIQGAGKSTFYKERFFETHVRLNLDMLRTRHRLKVLLRACIEAKQPFVVDNTNVTVEERATFTGAAKAAGFAVRGYYFVPNVADSLRRNAARDERRRGPVRGIMGTVKRLQAPARDEGFDALYRVSID